MKRTDRNAEYYNAYSQKEFYKGTSFRVNKWTPDSYYFNNEQYVDWVIYNGTLCVCARTHVSSEDNAPVLIYNQGVPVDIEPNPCWDFALGGLAFNSDNLLSDPTRMKLENNSFYISNDEGKTWEYVGSVITENPQTEVTADVISVNESDTAMADVKVINNNHLQFSFSLPKGKDGADGKDGKDGVDGANGTSGVDGNGFDYIFCLTETPTFDKLDPSSLEAVQDDLFIPEGWTSYSQQVNETNEYQWVSTRKKIQGSWGIYSKPVIFNSYATEGIVPEVSFTSFVFCRTNSTWLETDMLPQGGSYDSPYPTDSGTIGGKQVAWTDSIPKGTHQVWMTSRVFSTQNTSTTWAVPRVLTDTANFQVEYSREFVYSNPGNLQSYYDNDPINYEENWRIDNSTWSDEGTDAIWMATATMHNGVWSDWTVNKIKGEDGQNISDIYEYYIYTPKNYIPEPNWNNYEVGEDLINTDNTIWTKETIPTLSTGKTCLWNIEVIAYKDTGDGYHHTQPVLLSDRAMEVKSVDEYYLATSKESGVSFTVNNISEWTLVGPNAAVPNTDEKNKYLWNAELITYVDGRQCYSIPARIGVYIKGDKGDNADPVYSIILDRYEEFPLYVNQDGELSWLNDTYSFNMSFYKNNRLQTKNDFKIEISNDQIELVSYSQFDLKLKLKTVIPDEFSTTISFIDSKTETKLLETQIRFVPNQAILRVSLDPDTINLGLRKSAYGTETSATYPETSWNSTRFRAYINNEEISGEFLTVTIDQTNLADDVKRVLSNVTPVTGILHDFIKLDYTLYYKKYIEQNSSLKDLMSLVDSGELTKIPLLVQYTGTSLKIVANVNLTTYQLNPDNISISVYPNVILPADSDDKVRVKLYSSNDEYITANEIDNLSYKFQYNIDDSEWINVTSSHEFALGYFIWSKYNIMNNIKFRIIDESNKIYNQEIVERIGTDGILDYFNLPDYLLCSRTYTLPDGIYDFSSPSVVYNADNNSFYVKHYIKSIAITRYSSEDKKIILAKKIFNITYPDAINLGSNVSTEFGTALPIIYEAGCTSFNPQVSISLFNLKPGFTLVKDDSISVIANPKVFQFFIPYYWDKDETNIDSSDLNLLYNLVGNTYCIKFILSYGGNKRHGITWDTGIFSEEYGYDPQCTGIDTASDVLEFTESWLIFNIEYKSYIKDSGEIAVIPNITTKSNIVWNG